jgi:gliding motility-associated-like protein
MQFKIKLLYTFLAIILTQSAWSQVQIVSDANPVCAGVPTKYKISGANYDPSVDKIKWNLGGGSFAEDVLDPSALYDKEGKNTVTLEVNGTQVASLDVYVYVLDPVLTLSAVKGCEPLSVTFSTSYTTFSNAASGLPDISVISAKAVTGTGAGGIMNNGSFTYSYVAFSGGGTAVYLAGIEITDELGCVGTTTKQVTVYPKPIALMDPPSASSCYPPLEVDFGDVSDSRNSDNIVSWSWNLGEGTTSSSQNPPKVSYSSVGSYGVRLIITNSDGCIDTNDTKVGIGEPIANFTASTSVDTVCTNVRFTNTSSTDEVKWYVNGVRIYPRPAPNDNYITYNFTPLSKGWYTVTLVAEVTTDGVTCTDEISKDYYRSDVEAKFTVVPDYGCAFPFTAQFIDESKRAVSYDWFYDDADQESEEIGNHEYIYDKGEDTLKYILNGGHYYRPSLTILDKFGCPSSYQLPDPITVFEPDSRFMPDTVSGCVPLTVNFTDSCIFDRGVNDITEYIWNFGDGTIVNGVAPNDSNYTHTYTQPGIYYARLKIVTQMGCTDTSIWIPIAVGDPSLIDTDIIVSPVSGSTICPNTNITLEYPGYNNPDITGWHFDTPGNMVWSCLNGGSSPLITNFDDKIGPLSISLTAENDGCFKTGATIVNYNVEGPIGKITGYNIVSCDTSNSIFWYGEFQGVDSIMVYDGDGNSYKIISPQDNTPYRIDYLAAGDYTVTITSFSNTTSCPPYIDKIDIKLRNFEPNFTFEGFICKDLPFEFTATDLSLIGDKTYAGYAWQFRENYFWQEVGTPNVSHTFTDTGKYEITLKMVDLHGCVKDTTKEIIVSELKARIQQIPEFTCYNEDLGVDFMVKDSSEGIAPIAKWSWKILNQTSDTNSMQYSQGSYPFGGKIKIEFEVEDSAGCKSSLEAYHYVYRPDNFVLNVPTQACAGDKLDFSAVMSKPNHNLVKFKWLFDDGGYTLGNPADTILDVAGTYPVRLVVYEEHGCTDTSDVFDIEVQDYPIAKIGVYNLDVELNTELCIGSVITFTDDSEYPGSAQRGIVTWEFGETNGESSNENTPVYIYDGGGARTIKLTVESTFGCTSDTTRNIFIEGPEGGFSINRNKICIGEEITFDILVDENNPSVGFYTIDYADGNVDEEEPYSLSNSQKKHQYNFHPPGGFLRPKVILIASDPQSNCTVTLTDTIYIHEVIAGFDRNSIGEASIADSSKCFEPGIVHQFFNTSTGIDSWKFDYGDGKTPDAGNDGENPNNHVYDQFGIYNVRITVVQEDLGCRDTMIKPMILLPGPLINTADVIGCDGDSLLLMANAGPGSTYLWTPATGLNNDTIPNPVAKISRTVNYTVNVTDASGCAGQAEVEAKILKTPYLEQDLDCVYGDTTLFIGESLNLNLNINDPLYSYSWTPTDYLSCSDCYNPTATPLGSIAYNFVVNDNSGLECFTDYQGTICIIVREEASLDVPSGFSPNGDGVNDYVYVGGWGIKELVSFRIYNRWGDLVFETEDKTIGWDGTYNGELQEQDVYIYQVVATFYAIPEQKSKQGNITLFR